VKKREKETFENMPHAPIHSQRFEKGQIFFHQSKKGGMKKKKVGGAKTGTGRVLTSKTALLKGGTRKRFTKIQKKQPTLRKQTLNFGRYDTGQTSKER